MEPASPPAAPVAAPSPRCRIVRTVLKVGAVLAFCYVAGLVAWVVSLSLPEEPRVPRALPSVTGRHTLVPSVRKNEAGARELVLTVVDAGGQRTALDRVYAFSRRVELAWDGEERLWVASADVGTEAYVLVEQRWRPVPPDERERLPVPPRLTRSHKH